MPENGRPDDPPAQKVTDDEVLAAVASVTERLGAPAVSTTQVAAELPIARQTAKLRLDALAEAGAVGSLRVGQGHIWWLPKSGDAGIVDPSILERPVDYDAIDPEAIPADLADEIAVVHLPDAGPPETDWERLRRWGSRRSDDVFTLLILSFAFLVVPVSVSADLLAPFGIGVGFLDLVGFLGVAVGLLFGTFVGIARLAGAGGAWAAERGYVGEEIPITERFVTVSEWLLGR